MSLICLPNIRRRRLRSFRKPVDVQREIEAARRREIRRIRPKVSK